MRPLLTPQVFFATLLFLIAPIVGCQRSAESATVTLQWDSNRESDLAGYVVVYGTASGQLSNSVDVGNHTSYQFTGLETGRTYFFAVRAYNAAGQMGPVSTEIRTTIGTAQLTLTNFITNVSPPRPAGTTVTFAAAASGGTPPYTYKWLVFDGTTTVIARDWSGDNTFSWQPAIANPNYVVKAWARNAKNTADAPENGAERSMPFAITAAERTTVTLTSDRPAPQPAGTPLLFAASASGGSVAYEFQWSVFEKAVWKVQQDWSANASFSWTPTVANPDFKVMVRVRGGTGLAANVAVTMPYTIQ
jgi:hypothetical protein